MKDLKKLISFGVLTTSLQKYFVFSLLEFVLNWKIKDNELNNEQEFSSVNPEHSTFDKPHWRNVQGYNQKWSYYFFKVFLQRKHQSR
jgi:hypothetical protein